MRDKSLLDVSAVVLALRWASGLVGRRGTRAERARRKRLAQQGYARLQAQHAEDLEKRNASHN